MTVKLGLVGTGTVGGGCIDILKNHREEFKRHYGIDVELARVCSRNPEQAIEHGVEDIFTQDFHDILDDSDIDIVIELIGGTTVARDVVLGALRAGKNVVTANKALMATHGEEVMRTAEEAGKEIAFEASVGGGIPIIDPMKHSLIANRIDSVMGIVNGTTNYMLTRMAEDDMPYADVLAEAQAKGFAEADPTADVDGLDAAAKIAILASIAFNSRVTIDDVHAEGIRNITPLDLEIAKDMGYCVKLLAHAHRTEEGIDVRVHPTMLPLSHQLATVNGVYNAIYVVGDAVGETMFFGEGAGSGPAASAVMGDVLEVARHLQAGHPAVRGLHLHRQAAARAHGRAQDQVLHPLRRGRPLRRAGGHGRRVRQPRRERALGHPARQEGRQQRGHHVRHPHRPREERARRARRHRQARRRAARGAERHPRGGLAACGRNSPQNRRYAQGRGLQKRAPLALRRRRFAADFSVVNLVIPDRR